MKIILILIFAFIFLTCEHSISPVKRDNTYEYCPPPVYIEYTTYRFPKYIHQQQRLSPDGQKIAYKVRDEIRVLNLKTGEENIYDITKRVPSNVVIVDVSYPIWCPYDNNRLLVLVSGGTDTTGDGKYYKWGQNLWIFSLDGKELKRVTPSVLGPAGAEANLSISAWLPKSNTDNDLLLMTLPIKNRTNKIVIYNIQKDSYIDFIDNPILCINHDGSKVFAFRFGDEYKKVIYSLNDFDLHFDELFESDAEFKATFSPSGKYLAMAVRPYSQNYDVPDTILNKREEDYMRYTEIWIVDVEKVLTEHPDTVTLKKINLRKEFCMYAFAGVWPEFISENTLSVSMHKDGEENSFLWEITIDGKIVRQLTFEP